MLKFVNHTIVFALIVTTSLLGQDVALARGGFSASCPKRFLGRNARGAFLLASCYTKKHKLVGSALQLDRYIANNNGHLAWRKNGGFSASVRGCGLVLGRSSTILRCQARRRDGSYANASINLDDKIANYNGHLTVVDGF